MSEKKLNNTIYLMHMCTQLYISRTGITMQEFLKLDKKYKILKFIKDCSWEFDDIPYDDCFLKLKGYIDEKTN